MGLFVSVAEEAVVGRDDRSLGEVVEGEEWSSLASVMFFANEGSNRRGCRCRKSRWAKKRSTVQQHTLQLYNPKLRRLTSDEGKIPRDDIDDDVISQLA